MAGTNGDQGELHRAEDRGRWLDYYLLRKNVKNITIRIKPTGQVVVTAPVMAEYSRIDGFVAEKMPYIFKVQKRYEKEECFRGNLENYVTGEKLCYLGELYTLEVTEGWEEGILVRGKSICLTVRDADDLRHKERKINAWLSEEITKIILDLCREKIPLFEKYGVRNPEIRFKSLKSKWGSCMPTKNVVTFNTHLIETPLKCIEYVVIHELSHYAETNHSPAFYRVVAEFMPDYKRWDKLLNRYHI